MTKENPKIVITHSTKVKCSGPDYPHNHPTVYYIIPIEERNVTACFYCGNLFTYIPNANITQ